MPILALACFSLLVGLVSSALAGIIYSICFWWAGAPGDLELATWLAFGGGTTTGLICQLTLFYGYWKSI